MGRAQRLQIIVLALHGWTAPAVAMAVGQPRTSRPFIKMRLVGSWLALGAPRRPLPSATKGVAAQPTTKKRAPKRSARRVSREISPPTPS